MDIGGRGGIAKKVAAGVAVAALAVAGIAVVDRVQGPSESECNTQRLKVMQGERAMVESACVGR